MNLWENMALLRSYNRDDPDEVEHDAFGFLVDAYMSAIGEAGGASHRCYLVLSSEDDKIKATRKEAYRLRTRLKNAASSVVLAHFLSSTNMGKELAGEIHKLIPSLGEADAFSVETYIKVLHGATAMQNALSKDVVGLEALRKAAAKRWRERHPNG